MANWKDQSARKLLEHPSCSTVEPRDKVICPIGGYANFHMLQLLDQFLQLETTGNTAQARVKALEILLASKSSYQSFVYTHSGQYGCYW